MATNGNFNHQEQYPAAPASETPSATAAESTNSAPTPSKDEVGWYFVEQYYTTLSKNPSKLHLFYNKRSQFVQGPEAELVDVSVGRQAIQERIKELDFQDCKVRVSNVDSQASFENIVIQVIGEISNKSAEPKKFVQTFVLAQQPAGYFLLNDILRYISEGDEEASEGAGEEPAAIAAPAAEAESAQQAEQEPEATPAPAQVEEPVEETSVTLDAQVVDQKLEETSTAVQEAPSTTADDTPAESAPVTEETVNKPETPEATTSNPEQVAEEIATQETSQPEVPKEPSPTPAPAQTPAPEPEKPKGPPKPMTWASLAAAGSGKPAVKPAIPLPAKSTGSPASTRAPAAPAAAPVGAQANAPAPAEAATQTHNKEASEWRTAGADSKKQSRQHSAAAPNAEKDNALAYVKFVTDKVKEEDLKPALSAFGELVYFDINRIKTCAFVEYATAASCQAAIKASPITVAGESIAIETRRPKASAYGGANYSNNRGGNAGRGRGGFDGNRSGSQGGGRGGYPNRGRGAPRGRGGAQATNA